MLKHIYNLPQLKQSLGRNGNPVSFEILSRLVWVPKNALWPAYGRRESATNPPLPVLDSMQATVTIGTSISGVATPYEHPLQFVPSIAMFVLPRLVLPCGLFATVQPLRGGPGKAYY